MRKPDEPRIFGLPIKSEVVFDPDVPVPEFKVMQELLRHSSPKTTLEIYTQAVTPAKHAAQAAVLALLFPGKVEKLIAEI